MSGDNQGDTIGDTHGDATGEDRRAKTQKRSGVTSGRQTARPAATPPPARPRPANGAVSVPSLPAVADLLRAVANSIERDPVLARSLLGDQTESGPAITTASGTNASSDPVADKAERLSTTPGTKRPARSATASNPALDPFAVLRAHGESGLRTQLHTLDVEGLRTVVRAHRLDPARIASRWTDRERLVALIVEQVRARAGVGRAFERI